LIVVDGEKKQDNSEKKPGAGKRGKNSRGGSPYTAINGGS